ncbi:TPA_exp: hypothetical protein A8136_1883 [Trichophyton benhamiae CBS 112371]|nr:TPA_exp: hypothetical protein A8136_1883 [Trichophyton benhamiae CBS 112371]
MGNLTKPDDAVPARLLRGSVPPSPQVPSPQRLFTGIRSAILESQEHKDLIFENIPPETGALVIDTLGEDPDVENSCPRLSYNSFTLTINITIMPTFVYEAHTSWLHREATGMIRSGFLNESEEDSISFCGKPTFRGFKPPYSASRIEADFAILPDDQTFPSIVFESGWQESVPKLHHDKDLWLQGGRPQVQLVFLAKWSKDANGVVTGTLEAHGKNGIGSQLLQSEVVMISQDFLKDTFLNWNT